MEKVSWHCNFGESYLQIYMMFYILVYNWYVDIHELSVLSC